MIKILLEILKDEWGFALGITRSSICSAIIESTGDSGDDAIVKVNRLINRKGKQFLNITNWPFLRDQITFNITTSAYAYSGASYLPATFKKVVSAYIVDGTDHYPLEEDGIVERYTWPNPDDNDGRPDRFCITRMESGYWEIAFNRTPDDTYAVYMDIELQWTDLTADSSETVITKEYEDAFEHYCTMARLMQQGDTEQYALYKNEWDNNQPASPPRHSILGQILAGLSSPSKRKQIVMKESYVLPFQENVNFSTKDYNEKINI